MRNNPEIDLLARLGWRWIVEKMRMLEEKRRKKKKKRPWWDEEYGINENVPKRVSFLAVEQGDHSTPY